jgi:hypothetical protein
MPQCTPTQQNNNKKLKMGNHGIISKIHNILEPKASLSKYKKVEITPCFLLACNEIKLEPRNKKIIENI